MKKLLEIFTLLIFIINFSCSKDENKNNIQEQITIESSNLNITISENPISGEIIGEIQATTNIGQVSYSLVSQSPNGAFSINSENGDITVLDVTLFNYETYPEITGIIKLTNSDVSKEILITITLTDVEIEIFNGSLFLSSQEELNHFGSQNYKEIHGSLRIHDFQDSEFNMTNVDALNSITLITGSLDISGNKLLNNIDGLKGIKSIGNLYISSNDKLNNIDGLVGIENIDEDLYISGDNLININGLVNLNYLGGDLVLWFLPNLSDISLFPKFTEIKGSLRLINLPKLNNYDVFDQLSMVESNLTLSETNLSDLNVFKNLTYIGGGLGIGDNKKLINVNALSKINQLGGLNISGNSILENIDGLSNLTTLKGDLAISSNSILPNMNALNNLTSIGGFLYIYNTVFQNINALSNLQSVGGVIKIDSNSLLINLDGLNNLETIVGITPESEYEDYHFSIQENAILNDFCGLTKLFLNFPYNHYFIYGNSYNPTKEDLMNGICTE